MHIALFTTQVDAQAKLDLYDSLAQVPEGCTLTFIYQHTTQPIWFFIFDDCVGNGGLGVKEIENDMNNVTIEIFSNNQSLIDAGYLPVPVDG